ncbi:MAG: AbrB/MazE/SpoVT family DNA-binding domain-containing protein [Clostridia bacterium]|nr:AbrB/MazE/SpoVT family DNA-binding domain-containing protein [Clostridia bacterium]
MKKGDNGIEREVDKLGRVVLPINFRKRLGIERNSRVLISMDEETVLIKAYESLCAMCKKPGELNSDLGLCPSCIEKVKNYNV